MTTAHTDALDHLLARLIECQDERLHEAADTELPDSVLAGLLEGRLLPEVRDQALRRLVTSDVVRRIAAEEGLLDDLDVPLPLALHTTSSQGVRRWWVGAAAALVLLGIGIFVTARKYRPAPDITGDQLLMAVADELRTKAPTLFQDFVVLDPATRAALAPERRGGITLSMPRGLVVSGPLVFRWQPVPGATSYQVVLLDEDGETVRSVPVQGTSHFPYPEDGPQLRVGAAYTWKVLADGPLGQVDGSLSFRVGSRVEQERYANGLAFIEREASPPAQRVLGVQWGIHTGFLSEAYRNAREADAGESREPILRETWQYLRRQLQIEGPDSP